MSTISLTSAQCRAARALLDWTQQSLAKEAGVSESSVVDLERERRAVSPEILGRIAAALKRAGVKLIPENGGGAGVRLDRAKQSN